MMRVLLAGGTDLTIDVADRLAEIGLKPAGIVSVDRSFAISYRPEGVVNSRFANVAEWATENAVPHRLYGGTADIADLAREQEADFLLAVGWYHMIPASVRRLFARGSAGIHASLLPKLRGGAPLNWAILSGAREAGVSLFALSDGVDDGPVYGQTAIPLGPSTTIGDLVVASRQVALALVTECLPAIASGRLTPSPQEGAPTYGLQRVPEDGCIDWTGAAEEIHRLVRATGRPYPGAFTWLGQEQIVIWSAKVTQAPVVHGAPGQIFRIPGTDEPAVITGNGHLVIQAASRADEMDALPLLRKSANRRFQPYSH